MLQVVVVDETALPWMTSLLSPPSNTSNGADVMSDALSLEGPGGDGRSDEFGELLVERLGEGRKIK